MQALQTSNLQPYLQTYNIQPFNAGGIIKNFNRKYRKLLLWFVVSRIDEGKKTSKIIGDVHVLKAITWIETPWKSLSAETIK